MYDEDLNYGFGNCTAGWFDSVCRLVRGTEGSAGVLSLWSGIRISRASRGGPGAIHDVHARARSRALLDLQRPGSCSGSGVGWTSGGRPL